MYTGTCIYTTIPNTCTNYLVYTRVHVHVMYMFIYMHTCIYAHLFKLIFQTLSQIPVCVHYNLFLFYTLIQIAIIPYALMVINYTVICYNILHILNYDN